VPELFPWLLFLHVMAAIVAFGPTFAFSIIGAMGAAEPQHSNFATRVSHRIGDRLVEPLALTMPITGFALVWAAQTDLFAPDTRWLLLSIVLYAVGLSFSLFVSRPRVRRIIELTSGPPPQEPAAGPPPGLMDLVRVVQRVGMTLTVLTVVIVFLMVMKPSLGF
jgi:uncharacterized membrane protein